MTNTFDTAMAGTGQVFLDAFGEDIIYYPAGGGQRSIRAIIERQQAEVLPGVERSTSHVLSIEVLNDAVSGIAAAEFNGGKDTIDVEVRLSSGVYQKKRIPKILGQDSEMIKYKVQ